MALTYERLGGIIYNIQRYAIHDGPGIRVTIFLKGCPMCCGWCHNPESQLLEPESVEKEIILNNGAPLSEKECIGKAMTVPEVLTEIKKEIIFIDESGGGVTFSGGEPLMQLKFLNNLLEACNKNEIHTALDTSGYASPEDFHTVIDKVDLFLYDLKIMNDNLHQKYTGVSNQYVIENLKTLSERRKNIVIRFPVIPAITDTRENILEIKDFIVRLKNIKYLELLPYHRIADGKYEKLKRENKMEKLKTPTKGNLKALKQEFENHGLKTNEVI